MSDEMILMNQGALDALDEQAFDEGFRKGREEAEFEWRLVAAQHKKLAEILELTGDMNLMDAADQLGQEVRSHREASKAQLFALEAQRKKIVELRSMLTTRDQSLMTMSLTLDQQHNEIRDLKERLYGAGVVAAMKETP